MLRAERIMLSSGSELESEEWIPCRKKAHPVIQIQLVSSEKEQSRWDENEALHDSQEAGALWAPQAPSAREPPLQERIPLRETLLGGRLARNQDQVFGGAHEPWRT